MILQATTLETSSFELRLMRKWSKSVLLSEDLKHVTDAISWLKSVYFCMHSANEGRGKQVNI